MRTIQSLRIAKALPTISTHLTPSSILLRGTRVHPLAPTMKPIAPTCRQFHSTRPFRQSISTPQTIPSGDTLGSHLIPMVNRLQEVCSLVGEQVIDLPQIVVIGGQSSGKSSVLENLVGRDFLPRGNELVTRRPLILQLNRIADSSESTIFYSIAPNENTDEWGEFLHKPGEKFTFDGIREEIHRETERTTGKNKGISTEPILLRIYSPNVLPLTLVDTPGMTRVPVDARFTPGGDQPPDIEQRLRDMIMQFISKPNSIILAVQSATQDLATSDALKLAREVDPEGHRTIGVLTKIDIMDRGTNAMDTLMGKSIPLRLGFVGTISRSQHDINVGKSIRSSLDDEQKFFREHSVYNSLQDLCGTANLAAKCNRILAGHIYKALPSLKQQVRSKIKDKQEELQSYGTGTILEKGNQGWMLLHLLGKFSEEFKSAIDGIPEEINTTQLNGGARIRYIFYDAFYKHMQSVNPEEGLSTNDIRTAIRNAAGARNSLFVPDKAFEMLIKRQIENLREPCLRAADMVFDELMRILAQMDASELRRFSVLRHRVVDVANTTLRSCLKPTNKMIKNLVLMELAHINTSHPEFLGGNMIKQSIADQVQEVVIVEEPRHKVRTQDYNQPKQQKSGFFSSLFGGSEEEKPSPKMNKNNSLSSGRYAQSPFNTNDMPNVITVDNALSETDKIQIKLIKQLLGSYFKIVQKSLQENVTKAIMLFLVEAAKENLHKDLMSELYKEELFNELLHEDSRVVQRRQQCAEQLEALKQAKKIIQMAEIQSLSSK
ncbi:dynamin-2 [Planoprotostelium fungivorum]|uniref:Dynamin-2 n=1 Tax=Planoprotostelium fungivorum TaxID=1890364 RepID=A0A2P6NA46_9EUKA|nr:dynamin-2 [Planoprotostelium fungivorum]